MIGLREVKIFENFQAINLAIFLGIKLMQELIDRTEDETELQFLAQCVSHHRRTIGHTKKDYEKLNSF